MGSLSTAASGQSTATRSRIPVFSTMRAFDTDIHKAQWRNDANDSKEQAKGKRKRATEAPAERKESKSQNHHGGNGNDDGCCCTHVERQNHRQAQSSTHGPKQTQKS